MKSQNFFVACEQAFANLFKEYHLSNASNRDDNYVWEWTVKNLTTGIRVVYEIRDGYLFIQICRLVNGEVKSSIGEIWPDTTIDCFDFEDLLSLRKPNHQHLYSILSESLEKNLTLMLKQYAGSLEIYAEDILLGDFAIFSDLERIVKERARTAAHQKWGEKAKDFGW